MTDSELLVVLKPLHDARDKKYSKETLGLLYEEFGQVSESLLAKAVKAIVREDDTSFLPTPARIHKAIDKVQEEFNREIDEHYKVRENAPVFLTKQESIRELRQAIEAESETHIKAILKNLYKSAVKGHNSLQKSIAEAVNLSA